MFLKVFDSGVQPDGIAKVHLIADLFKTMENLMCSGIVAVVTDYRVPEHVVVFPDFSP